VPSAGGASGFSWTIVWLLFFATTINYIDRTVFGILGPLLQGEFRWSEVEYSRMIMAFQLTYAIGYAGAGRLLDRIGVRAGYPLVVGIWSLAAMAHGMVALLPPQARVALWGGNSTLAVVLAFGAARAVLGLAQGGNFPAAMKTVTEWFPKEQRALATGLFNSGSNAGAIVCPLLVPALYAACGWSGAFYITGAAGLLWLAAWWKLYPADRASRPAVPALSAAPPEPAIPWLRLLGLRQTWMFLVGMCGSAPVWWFYIFWGPKFLNRHFHLDLQGSSLPLTLIFLGAVLGGIVAGWMTSALLRRGWSLNAARKIALLACALGAVPVCAVPFLDNVWGAVALLMLAAGAHCGFAANLYPLVGDLFAPEYAASVTGIGGMAGSLVALAFAEVAGRLLNVGEVNYRLLFAGCAASYVIAVGIMHALSPRLEPVRQPQP